MQVKEDVANDILKDGSVAGFASLQLCLLEIASEDPFRLPLSLTKLLGLRITVIHTSRLETILAWGGC